MTDRCLSCGAPAVHTITLYRHPVRVCLRHLNHWRTPAVWVERRTADRALRRTVTDARYALGLRPVTIRGLPPQTPAERSWRSAQDREDMRATIAAAGSRISHAFRQIQRAFDGLAGASIPGSASTRQEDPSDRIPGGPGPD